MAEEQLAELVDSLLYEGYALYPYTSAAMKNSTPTPFGIAYPPAYAASLSSTFDHLELRCALEAPVSAPIEAEVRYLAACGEGHRAEARRMELPPASIGELAARPEAVPHSLLRRIGATGRPGAGELDVRLALSARQLGQGTYEIALRVENRTRCTPGLDRAGALRNALISTHPIVRVRGGRFISPLERPCASVNTFPVLASAADDAVIGAAIVLPDHPQVAPESRGGMFDSTEIEEALLLHVKTLTDRERAEIERDDPRVREVIARAEAATPEELLALHGRVTVRDPGQSRSRVTTSPPREPEGLLDPTLGEPHAVLDGIRLHRGGKVRLRPGRDADLHARMLEGRTATVERILVDYDGKVHLGVTIDGDPGQELLRESGRLLFFFPGEVEVLER